jgi:asparagine synthase (glutamine-hydrolysing)
LIRDHLGVKPLAYALYNDRLYFSSDYLDLGKVFSKGKKPDRDFLIQFVRDISYIAYDKTPNSKVKKVLPGHFLVVDKNSVKAMKYWFPESIPQKKYLNSREVIQKMKCLVENAVQIRCSKNLRTGSHVSGGWDSALVSTMVKKQYAEQEPFFGFSWSPPSEELIEHQFDERKLVELLAKEFELKNEYLLLNPLENWERLSNWKYYGYFFQEEQVLKSCQEKGIHVLFSGWGGDEFLSINDRGMYYDLFFGMNWGRFLQKMPLRQAKVLLHTLIFQVIFPFLGFSAVNKNQDRWFLGYFKKPFNRRNYDSLFFKKGSRRKTHLNLLYNYHIPWRMESEFILGNQYGVAFRYPLLDRRIIEFMLQIPSKIMADFPYSRPLIREISRGILPEQVRLHQSKLDAARLEHFYVFLKMTLPFFQRELEEIKHNPDLCFLDFRKIEEDMEKVHNGTYSCDENEFLLLLNNIKKMHEFSRRYTMRD